MTVEIRSSSTKSGPPGVTVKATNLAWDEDRVRAVNQAWFAWNEINDLIDGQAQAEITARLKMSIEDEVRFSLGQEKKP